MKLYLACIALGVCDGANVATNPILTNKSTFQLCTIASSMIEMKCPDFYLTSVFKEFFVHVDTLNTISLVELGAAFDSGLGLAELM